MSGNESEELPPFALDKTMGVNLTRLINQCTYSGLGDTAKRLADAWAQLRLAVLSAQLALSRAEYLKSPILEPKTQNDKDAHL